MSSLNPVGQLAEYYTQNPALRALVNLLTGGGSLDVLLSARAQEIAQERAQVFFEELSKGTAEITPELIQSEDFIHRYVITAKVAANTYRKEKIRRFARMLVSSFQDRVAIDTDEYEEYLQIVNDLSYREFFVLSVLEKWECNTPFDEDKVVEGVGEYVRAEQFWGKFLVEVQEKLHIDVDEVNAILARLNRTGCYITFTGAYWGHRGDRGNLTDTYYRIKTLVHEEV